MRVSYNWLKEYVEIPLSPEELAQRLTDRGVVVETLTSANPGVEGVVIGKVLKVEPHPNADTLWVCQVDVGGGRVLQVLTGAPNVFEGAIVPAAIPGSRLPGMEMGVKNLRGLDSHGMLCSAVELGVGDDADGILILPPDPSLQPGMDAAEVLGLNDWIFELDLTANYASHCQSMVGVAQEVAAILGTSVRWPDHYTEDDPESDIQGMVAIRIEEPDLCSRYVGRIVRGIRIGPSPVWMQARLRAAGMRPINNIVDIANYVMLELGQPLHTFDYQKLGGRQIIVRRATPGEKIVTLDEQERTLDPEVLVIADATHPVAMAGVMGSLDSEVTEETTDILIESAAFDNINNRRTALRYNLPSEAARRFTKGVDPSGCLRAADRAAQLIARLAGGTVVRGHVDALARPSVPPVIVMRVSKVNDHLGLSLTADRMADHLNRLGMAVLPPADLVADLAAGKPDPAEEEQGEDLGGRRVWTAMHQVSPVPAAPEAYRSWADAAWAALEQAGERLAAIGDQEALVVVVPTRRLDVMEEIDLVEEVARSEGYDAIGTELPALASNRGGRGRLGEYVLRARIALAGGGLDEVLSHSLTHPRVYDRLQLPADSPYRRVVTIANPLYEDRSTLRTTLMPGVLDILQYNANRQMRDLAVFELSHVYLPQGGQQLPDEPRMLCIALMGNQAAPGWNSPARPADFFVLKGHIEHLLRTLDVQGWTVERSAHPSFHPGRQAKLLVDGEETGVFGELHPAVQEAWDLPERVYMAELHFEKLVARARPEREYRPVPRFPAVTRDLAFVISQQTPAATVAETIRRAGGDLVEGVLLFDVYQGEHVREGYRSLAYRITYRAGDRTLTDADVEAVHDRVRQALKELGAELRS